MKQNLVQPECFCQVSLLTTTHWSAGSSAAIWLRSQSAFLLSLFLAFVLFLFSPLLFPFLYIFLAVTLGKPVLLIFLLMLLSITLPLSPGIFICITPATKLHQRSYILPPILNILQYVQNMEKQAHQQKQEAVLGGGVVGTDKGAVALEVLLQYRICLTLPKAHTGVNPGWLVWLRWLHFRAWGFRSCPATQHKLQGSSKAFCNHEQKNV